MVGTFLGDFLVIRRLGRGGFGRVLLGLQRPHFMLHAAIKLLDADTADDAQRRGLLARFENEAKALAVLRHPNVVSLLRFGRLARHPYLVMEYVPGGRTLSSALDERRGAPTDLAIVRRVLDQLLRGLDAAHRAGIIHRDLKPDNVMLETIDGDPWHLKIVDFGLAKNFTERRDTSMVAGTLCYMAPEQFSCSNLGPWTDLYAVAAIAFELVTGVELFTGGQFEMLAQKQDPFASPHVADVFQALPAGAQGFFKRALAFETQRRPASVAAFREALDGALQALALAVADTAAGAPRLIAPEASTVRRFATAPTPKAHKRMWLLAATVLAVAAVATLVAFNSAGSTRPPPSPWGTFTARALARVDAPAHPPSLTTATLATPPSAAAAAQPAILESDASSAPRHGTRTKPGATTKPRADRTTTAGAGGTATSAGNDDLPSVRKDDTVDLPDLRKKDPPRP